MVILHDAGIDQGGFGAAEGASQQLPVLREAAGFGTMSLQDAGRASIRWAASATVGVRVWVNKTGRVGGSCVMEHIGVSDAWVESVTRTLV